MSADQFSYKSQLFSLIEYKARELSREQALRDLKVKLGPCYRYGDKILATLFYEIYLGSDNIMKLYGLKPRYVKASDFINHERIITTKSSLSFPKRKIPKGLSNNNWEN